MSKVKDLLETVKYMIIQNGFDSVPLSLLKKAIDASIAELETQEAKSCKTCKFADADDQACTILTHAVLESNAMPKTFYCSLFELKDT